MSQRLTIISSDGHCGPQTPVYRDYLEQRYFDDFDRYAEEHVGIIFEDVMLEGETAERWKQELVHEGHADATWDADKRIKELEDEGVVGEILYPDGSRQNDVPFTGTFGVGKSKYSHELALAGQRAYNRWLADFCGKHPDRLGGLALVQFRDVEAAVREVEWAAAQPGIRGILVPGIDPALPPYFSRYYDPIWSACVAADLAINVHVGAGGDERGLGGDIEDELASKDEPGSAAALLITVGELSFFAHRPLWFLIAGGVLDRFPTMRVAFTEQFADWIPRILDYLDWANARMPYKGVRGIQHAPSEYWKRQCYVGASTPSRTEAAMRHEIGIDNLMYGMDFPHYEGTWGRTRKFIRATFGDAGTTPEEARKIFAENVARCYRFDLAVLDEVAQRVGPTADEILGPSDIDDSDPFFAMVSRPLSF
jgi:predicted TIM-barrel fold metal-dependent hydrolase